MNKTVKLLLYCTKAKPYLVDTEGLLQGEKRFILAGNEEDFIKRYYGNQAGKKVGLNGKVVAEADCELVEDLSKYEYAYKDNHFYDVLKNACLTTRDLEKYCPVKRGERKSVYGIYLMNVKPLDEPKELSEYFKIDRYEKGRTPLVTELLEAAPQNMCYVYDYDEGDAVVLISIKPEWLCKILNGDKTIEIRKSILNLLKELM